MLVVTAVDKQPVSLFCVRSHSRMTQAPYLQQPEEAFTSGALTR